MPHRVYVSSRVDKGGGGGVIEEVRSRAHMCERLSGRGERAREGGESAAGRMLTGSVFAVQRAGSEAGRCTADGKRQVSSLKPEREKE